MNDSAVSWLLQYEVRDGFNETVTETIYSPTVLVLRLQQLAPLSGRFTVTKQNMENDER